MTHESNSARALPEEMHQELQNSAAAQSQGPPSEAVYLWLKVDESGIGGATLEGRRRLELQDWLNVVDESAALGVNWLVISLTVSLEAFPEIWDICRWAQDTHDMCVGVHLVCSKVSEEGMHGLATLDPEHTRVLVAKGLDSAMEPLRAHGIRVAHADPERGPHAERCDMPQKMVYVSADGALYTCGMVAGSEKYRLGNVFDSKFLRVLRDESLPHCVPANDAHNAHGCDGCPPLVAQYFSQA